MLSVGLYAVFPAFSDVYRLWRRQAGVVPGELAPDAFEYPPVAAAIWEPFTWLPSARSAVVANGILMVLAAVGVTWLLQRYHEEGLSPDRRIWIASPALLILLPMNWDVGVAFTVISGLALLVSTSTSTAGVSLGVGLAWKISPGSLVLPLLPLIADRRRRATFLVTGVLTVGAAYTAFILLKPNIWQIHLDFASSRADYQQTIWGGVDWVVSLLGFDMSGGAINIMSTIAVIVSLLALTIWVGRHHPTFAEAATLAMTLFVLFNKVFKPAYVLWLIPLLALAGTRRTSARAIEAGALIYFAVVFFPLPGWLAPVAAGVMIIALALVVIEVARRYSIGESTRTSVG